MFPVKASDNDFLGFINRGIVCIDSVEVVDDDFSDSSKQSSDFQVSGGLIEIILFE